MDTAPNSYEKQQTFNTNIVKRIQELEDFKGQALIRLDQEIENRTKAFERIEELENNIELMERYSIGGLKKDLRDLQYETNVKLERIDEILVAQRNKTDSQRKNFNALQKVWDEKVMNLLEKGEYEKEKG